MGAADAAKYRNFFFFFFAGIERNMRPRYRDNWKDLCWPAVVVQKKKRLIDQVRTHAIATEDYQSSIFFGSRYCYYRRRA